MSVWEAGAQLDEATLARRSAGKAVRDLGHALVGHHADPVLLDEVAATLNQLAARLDAGGSRSRPVSEFADRSRSVPTGVAVESYDDRPFSGQASPWGLDLEVHRFGDTIQADLTLRSAHEGAPGRSHGGIVAGLFDDVFGFVLGTVQEPAFTGELSIRYERPTPLHRRLRCTGQVLRREGRKLWIGGELIDLTVEGQPVVARGEGLFITVDPQVFRLASQELPAPDPE
jgi:acyl-coenzyme A thioesterase PaaI-like protein